MHDPVPAGVPILAFVMLIWPVCALFAGAIMAWIGWHFSQFIRSLFTPPIYPAPEPRDASHAWIGVRESSRDGSS